jgi:hypothetical protein
VTEERPQPTRRGTLYSLADLQRWEDSGATWRALDVGPEGALIELCTCYGEPVDVVRGEASELIEFIRARRDD